MAQGGVVLWLLRGDVSGAERDLDGAIASWFEVQRSFLVQHFYELYSRCELAPNAPGPLGAVAHGFRLGA